MFRRCVVTVPLLPVDGPNGIDENRFPEAIIGQVRYGKGSQHRDENVGVHFNLVFGNRMVLNIPVPTPTLPH